MKKLIMVTALIACVSTIASAQKREEMEYIGGAYIEHIDYSRETIGRLLSQIKFIRQPDLVSLEPYKDTSTGKKTVRLIFFQPTEPVTRTEAYALMRKHGLKPASAQDLLVFIRNTAFLKPKFGVIILDPKDPNSGLMFFTDGHWLRIHTSTSTTRWHSYFAAVDAR